MRLLQMSAWWETFFDADYLRLWEGAEAPNKTESQVMGLWAVLNLTAESRVLERPAAMDGSRVRLQRAGPMSSAWISQPNSSLKLSGGGAGGPLSALRRHLPAGDGLHRLVRRGHSPRENAA